MTQGVRTRGPLQPNQSHRDENACCGMNEDQASLPAAVSSDHIELRKTTATPPATCERMPWKGNEFHHVEDRDRLHPNHPRGYSSRQRAFSDSGSSGFSSITFQRIETMPARGILSHASYELSRSAPNGVRPSRASTSPLPTEPFVTVASVRNKLRKAIIPSKLKVKESTKFLPLDKQSEIVTPEVTRQMLLNSRELDYTPEAADRIVQRVFQEWPSTSLTLDSRIGGPGAGWQATRRRRILIILILISKVDRISLFIDNDIDDLALPIDCNCDDENNQNYTSGRDWGHNEPPDLANRLNACFEGFDDDEFDLFRANQKRVHVPFFQFPTRDDMQIYHFNLDADCVLPIIDVGRHDGPVPEFALKKLKSQGEEPFREEVEVFEKLVHSRRPRSPDHLLRLELAFMHGEQGYLLFTWAEGSLKDYWKEEWRDPTNPVDVQWFFEQCYGLALGLRRLHDPNSYERSQFQSGLGLRSGHAHDGSHGAADGDEEVENLRRMATAKDDGKYGRHTDVKPDNILWYRQYEDQSNHLVISDFGSAQFNSHDTRSNVSPGVAGQKGTTNTYQAPELSFGIKVTRTYDIWSLGCVFLEFAVWFHQGSWQAVEDFAKQRSRDRQEVEQRSLQFSEDMFYLVVPNNTWHGAGCQGIKPSVTARIDAIRALDSCTEATRSFLDLIQKNMLVPEAEKRLDGRMIRQQLNTIRAKCRKDLDRVQDGVGGYEADFQPQIVSPAAGYFDGTSPETKAREFSRDVEETIKSALQDPPIITESPGHCRDDDSAQPTITGTGRSRGRPYYRQ
ncbi:kinase-like domain-containing protein [Plectosphaerella plurivora]|uniref:Kinase-like domain-containing protein n=1 Tax=Plectosphaerella plurivora TaxID=936078 RepID=A0A9P8VFN6_9PEZI|nr:kinase-like domain-containing protein [Plectosphaerella plurivora]